MKFKRALFVLASLGLLGTLAFGSGSAVAQPATTAGSAPKLGSSLIGKLEGPTLVLDAKAYPKSFKEAPDARPAGEGGQAAAGREAPAGAVAAPGREAVARDRQVRRQLAARVHGTGRPRERQSHRLGGQDPHLRLHGHQDRPEPRARLEGERRRQDHHDLPAQGRQVVRRQAAHRRRFHVLVQRHLPQQEHRPDPVLRVPDRRQGRQDAQGRRLHRRLRVSRAVCVLRVPARGQHGDRGRARHARRVPELGRRVRAGALPEAVPAEVLVGGGRQQEGEGARLRQLGVAAAQPLQLGAQSRPAGDDAVEDRVADQHADVVDGAQPLLLGRRHRGQPAALHRQDHDDARGEHGGRQPARDRRRVRHPGTAHGPRQAAGVPREPEEGQLHGPPRSGAQRLGRRACTSATRTKATPRS